MDESLKESYPATKWSLTWLIFTSVCSVFPVSHLFRHISTFPQVPAVFYSLFALMIFPVWAALGQARQPGLRCRPGPDPSLLLGSRVQHPQVPLFPTADPQWFEGWDFPGLVSFWSIHKLLDLLPTLAAIWTFRLAGLFLRHLSAQVQGVLATFSRGTKYSISISLPFEHLTQKKRPQQSINPNCSSLRH